MEPGGKGGENFDGASFRGGFVEMLGTGEFDGSELLNIGEGEEEEREEGEELQGMVEKGFLGLRCPSAYLPLSSSSSPSSSSSYYQMLCFRGEESFHNSTSHHQTSGDNGFPLPQSMESSTSTSSSSGNSTLSKAKKAEGRRRKTTTGATAAISTTTTASTTTTSAAAAKKPKKEQQQQPQRPTTSRGGGGALKVRKEKLGERISTLQQLVSPFGKSDTASVLHEALGYIRFLHDQVQVLSSPYLQRLPSSAAHLHGGPEEMEEQMKSTTATITTTTEDLRSRGLCLVPISCTVHVAGSNGADFWSPAMGGSEHFSPDSVSKH